MKKQQALDLLAKLPQIEKYNLEEVVEDLFYGIPPTHIENKGRQIRRLETDNKLKRARRIALALRKKENADEVVIKRGIEAAKKARLKYAKGS